MYSNFMEDIETFKLRDIWLTEIDLYNELEAENASSSNWREYYSNTSVVEIINKCISKIFQKYGVLNVRSFSIDSFRIDFIDRFTDMFPAFLNNLIGDLSKYENTKVIGDYKYNGDTPTTLKDSDNFENPKQYSNYQFSQKSDKKLLEALETKSQYWTKWLNLFSSYFNNVKCEDTRTLNLAYDQVITNKDDIENLENTNIEVQSQIDLNTSNIENNKSEIGHLPDLVTNDKTNLVLSINEVSAKTVLNSNHIGELTSLTTSAKNNTVESINEVHSISWTNKGDIGTLDYLNTSTHADIVAAVNEVHSNADTNSGNISLISEALEKSFDTFGEYKGVGGSVIEGIEFIPVFTELKPIDPQYIDFDLVTSEFHILVEGSGELAINGNVSNTGVAKTISIRVYLNGSFYFERSIEISADTSIHINQIIKVDKMFEGDTYQIRYFYSVGAGDVTSSGLNYLINYSGKNLAEIILSSDIVNDKIAAPGLGINIDLNKLEGILSRLTSLESDLANTQTDLANTQTDIANTEAEIIKRELPIGSIIFSTNAPDYGTWSHVTCSSTFTPLFGGSYGGIYHGAVKKHNHKWASSIKQSSYDAKNEDKAIAVISSYTSGGSGYKIGSDYDNAWTYNDDAYTYWNDGYNSSDNLASGVYMGMTSMWKRTA